MSRFGRAGRRADQWASPHDRARARAAERLQARLKPSEAAWLDAHLSECASCAAIAQAYAADRLALRRLRDVDPEPPRDLWARTAAGIEREAAARDRSRLPKGRRAPGPRPAIGAFSALVVVAVVLVATGLSGGFFGDHGIALASSHPGPSQIGSIRVAPTAIAVVPGQVRWLGVRDDGGFAYNVADINAVCPLDRQPDCAPFADGHARRVTLTTTPKFVFQSPVNDQAIVVGTDAAGADAVIVVALPTPEPPAEPAPSDTIASGSPSPSVASATTETTALPAPTVNLEATPDATASAGPNGVTSPSPMSSDTMTESAEPAGSASPEPTVGSAFAILTNVTIVGRGAGYSPDGAWFAFSARPADGSMGADIYAWHVGDPQAVPLTSDHASVFASWVGNKLLGSRIASPEAAPEESPRLDASASPEATPTPTPTPSPTPSPVPTPTPDSGSVDEASASAAVPPTPSPEFMAVTFLVDPTTGMQTPMLGADWQPAVDPTGMWVAAWEGTVHAAPDGLAMVPATGRLVLHAFQALDLVAASPGPTEVPSLEPTLQPTTQPASTSSDQPSSPAEASATSSATPAFESQVLAEGPIAEFDARWDDTGTWLAIWLADLVDPSIGRLSLLHVDPITGLISRPAGAPQDVPALPGFSIGAGRLAWATPPGQGGEGSRIQIVAWTLDQVGAVESVPVEGAIVVQ